MPSSVASEFFKTMQAAWARAAATGDVVDRLYEIAGLDIRLEFSGPAMLSAVAPAFSHLALHDRGAEPAITIRLWDCASAGVAMPRAPGAMGYYSVRGEVPGIDGGRYYAAFQPGSRMQSAFDTQAHEAFVCAVDASQIPTVERAAPLRALLGWLMRHHGRQLVHAAAVGSAKSGVLLVGMGGSGKSNTALGCLMAGLRYAGDDYCAISIDPAPAVHSLYCTAKIASGDWAQPAFAEANPQDPETEKRLYFLEPHYRERLPANMPVLAVLLPRKTGQGDPCVQRISAATPVLETVRQTSAMLSHAGAEVLLNVSRLARQVPCYRLDLGLSPGRIPRLISDLIATLESNGGD
jgi:hypothetical protein